MRVPQPIPYQGSKRNIARYILGFFPDEFHTLIEPFAGSAAISIAAAATGKASRFWLNDINHPLMRLWDAIINNPEHVSSSYATLWREQQGKEKDYYFRIREEFNRTGRPEYLLYLLARCVKASVRYNAKGEFNQSPDNRRKGRLPHSMSEDIYAVSQLFRGRTVLSSVDYGEVLQLASPYDLVYMDPPYQGVCENRDPRYYTGVAFERFLSDLTKLANRGVPFIVSYDGRRGDKTYGREIPADIGVRRVEIKAGRSSQATLLGKSDITYESVYVSETLLNRLGLAEKDVSSRRSLTFQQLNLPLLQKTV